MGEVRRKRGNRGMGLREIGWWLSEEGRKRIKGERVESFRKGKAEGRKGR